MAVPLLILVMAPFGVHLLKILTAAQLKLGLGLVLIASTSAHFFKSGAKGGSVAAGPVMHSPVTTVCVGGISGVFGGALGMTGPLLADHLIKTGIRSEGFKVTLNLVFVLSAIWRTGLYLQQDILSGHTLMLGLTAVPVQGELGGRS